MDEETTSTGRPADHAEETSGDYSYDLAHDVGAQSGEHHRPIHTSVPAQGDAAPPEGYSDYSYDLAHEVPPPRRRS